jgi:EAL domain-containing protein (putative c-di-GMP-specific phosphodiesterase class I)
VSSKPSRDGHSDGHLILKKLHGLRCFYQPVVALETGTTVGVEALVRLQHPTMGLLLPDSFIPDAEASGFIVAIDDWVLQAASRRLASWLSQKEVGKAFTLSVNLSARSLARPYLFQRVEETLSHRGLEPHYLQLELTETSIIEDTGLAARTIERLRGLGVRVALDDFGIGYSSLGNLQRFCFDTLKLDRFFVEHVEQNERAAAVVKAAINLAETLDMGLIAEGVESRAQAITLLRLGCRYAQGFLFGKPVPEEQIRRQFRLQANPK